MERNTQITTHRDVNHDASGCKEQASPSIGKQSGVDAYMIQGPGRDHVATMSRPRSGRRDCPQVRFRGKPFKAASAKETSRTLRSSMARGSALVLPTCIDNFRDAGVSVCTSFLSHLSPPSLVMQVCRGALADSFLVVRRALIAHTHLDLAPVLGARLPLAQEQRPTLNTR